MIKICISVTSHALYPLPLSPTVTPSQTPPPFERDVLYGRQYTTCQTTEQFMVLNADVREEGLVKCGYCLLFCFFCVHFGLRASTVDNEDSSRTVQHSSAADFEVTYTNIRLRYITTGTAT